MKMKRKSGLPDGNYIDVLNQLVDKRYGELNPRSYKIKGLEEVAEEIKNAVANDRYIIIIGDYDADGISGTSECCKIITYLGGKPHFKIPRRIADGYGLNPHMIDDIPEGALIITVDNGIVAFDAISKAKAKNCKVVVIDHHLPSADGRLPDADIIIDPVAVPGQCEYTKYCGAGLVYKLAEVIVSDRDLLDEINAIAAIATIADCVDLDGENHVICQSLPDTWRNKGLDSLAQAFGIWKADEHDAGFKFGPAFNAAERMGDDRAKYVVELLTSEDDNRIRELTEMIVGWNAERKALCEVKTQEAIDYIDANMADNNPICYIADVPEGIVGIIAGRITEKYQVPAFCFARKGVDESGRMILKGSARTAGDNHVKNILDSCSDLLLKYGGHAAAAGLSLYEDNLEEFQKKASTFCKPVPKTDTVEYEISLKPVYVGKQIAECLEILDRITPFGQGNPQFAFKVSGVRLYPQGGKLYRQMGSQGQYIKFFGRDFDILAFDGLYDIESPDDLEDKMSIVGYLSMNVFNGKETPQIEAVYIEKDARDFVKPNPFAARAAEKRA